MGAGASVCAQPIGGPSRAEERQAGETCRQELIARLPGSTQGTVLVSQAHSAGWVISVGFSADAQSDWVEGVGVDLERLDREVRPDVLQRVSSPEEAALSLNLIHLWVVKEACFKANPDNAGTVIPQYRVRSCASLDVAGAQQGEVEVTAHPSDPRGLTRRLQFLLTESQGWAVAFAKAVA
jgi:hypothetical protein